MKRVIVQWIGHSDLRAMAASLPGPQRDEIMQHVKGETPKVGDVGPIKTLLNTQQFDEIQLLSNYPATWNKRFAAWLGVKAEIVTVDLKKPTDYKAIFPIADAALSEVRRRKNWDETQLCLHLSPGTPAMAAVWLLLGKTRYPATFYETFAGKSWITFLEKHQRSAHFVAWATTGIKRLTFESSRPRTAICTMQSVKEDSAKTCSIASPPSRSRFRRCGTEKPTFLELRKSCSTRSIASSRRKNQITGTNPFLGPQWRL